MRHPSVSRHSFLVLSAAFALMSVPAHATTTYAIQTNEYYGINCQVVPSATNRYAATLQPGGLALEQVPGTGTPTATFYCPAAFSTIMTNPWMTNISFSIDARGIPSDSPVTASCQAVLVTTNLGVFVNNLPASSTGSYYGVDSAHLNCSISAVDARIYGYKLMVSYYQAAPP